MKFYRFLNLLKMPFALIEARLYPVRYARRIGVKLGRDVVIYGSSYSMFSSEPFLVTIGDNVHITHATFLCHDGGVLPLRKDYPDLDITEPITVGSNTFVGFHAIILPGITIGENCLIAAGAVVAKDVPDGSVAAGNPARVVGTMEDYLRRAKEKSTGLGAYIGYDKRRKYLDYFGLDS